MEPFLYRGPSKAEQLGRAKAEKEIIEKAINALGELRNKRGLTLDQYSDEQTVARDALMQDWQRLDALITNIKKDL